MFEVVLSVTLLGLENCAHQTMNMKIKVQAYLFFGSMHLRKVGGGTKPKSNRERGGNVNLLKVKGDIYASIYSSGSREMTLFKNRRVIINWRILWAKIGF